MKGVIKFNKLDGGTMVKRGEIYLYNNKVVKVQKDATPIGMGQTMTSFQLENVNTSYYMPVTTLYNVAIVDEDTGDLVPLCKEYYKVVSELDMEDKPVDFEYHVTEDQIIMCRLVLPSDTFYTEHAVKEHLRNVSNFIAEAVKRNSSYTEEDINFVITSYWNNNKSFKK